MRTARLQKLLNNLLTAEDLKKAFGVSKMTIYLWRENRALPALVIQSNTRNAVRYVPEDIATWAKRHKVPIRDKKAFRRSRSK